MAISYNAREWKDGASGGTSIDAASLNRMEAGIQDTVNAVNGLLSGSAAKAKDLKPTTDIPTGSNLDMYLDAGSYSCTAEASAGVTHKPDGVTGAFVLYVYEQQGGGLIHELIDGAGALHLRARAEGAWSAWSSPADNEAVAKGYLATPDGYKRKVTFGTAVFSGSSFTSEGTQAWCTLISAASWSEKYAIKGVLGVDSVIAYNGEPAANGFTVRGTTFAYDGSVRVWTEGKPTGSIRINWVAIGRTE